MAEQGITGWEALALELDGFLNDYTGTFSLSVAQNSEGQYELYVNYTAVPEPTTLALLLGGAALLATLAIRRRQDRSAASRQT